MQHLTYCNGLASRSVGKSDFDSFVRLLSAAGLEAADIQINVDWRQTGTTIGSYVARAVELFGARLRSIVSYLDPAHSWEEVRELLTTKPEHSRPGVLYARVVIRSEESVRRFLDVLPYVDPSRVNPLLSCDGASLRLASLLKERLIDAGAPIALQATHETPASHFELFGNAAFKVAQIAIGSDAEILSDGTICLDDGMVVRGRYNLRRHFAQMSSLPEALPVVMGPALPQWSHADNVRRVRRFVEVTRRLAATSSQWRFTPPAEHPGHSLSGTAAL